MSPKTAEVEIEVESAQALHGVKTILRELTASGKVPGSFTGAEVDAYVGSFLNNGWELVSANFGGRREVGTGDARVAAFTMIYVLKK